MAIHVEKQAQSFSSPKVWGIYLLGVISGILVSQFLNDASHLKVILQGVSTSISGNDIKNTAAKPNSRVRSYAALSNSSSAFDIMADSAYEHMLDRLPVSVPEKQPFDATKWKDTTTGGLMDEDRTLLARIYSQADSVLEYGLGESTYIANHVGVRCYAGIDSDPVWVANTGAKVSDRFRFYLADIGETKGWGYPKKLLGKQMLDFQLAPLILERDAFDVYMVDGRFRFPCVLASFLHASARGAPAESTTVLLHDCGPTPATQPQGGNQKEKRKNYHEGDDLLDIVEHSGQKLCVFKRKPSTMDNDLLDRWLQFKLDVNR
jgi:hypothetical protein